jgi:hypothetical protein
MHAALQLVRCTPLPTRCACLRALAARSDLLTHVVRDTDVAAADPFESLPPGFPVPPGSRFAAPRPAPPPLPPRAPTPALASTAAGRRRPGGSAGGSAAPSPGGAWGTGGPLGLAGLGLAVPMVDEEQGRADAGLMDELEGEGPAAAPWGGAGCGMTAGPLCVTTREGRLAVAAAPVRCSQPVRPVPAPSRPRPTPGTLQRKAAVLAQLSALTATADGGMHLDVASGAPSADFETDYATAVRDLQIANAQLARAVASLEARPHLGLPPSQLKAAIAAAAVAQQQQQAAAAAAALAAGGPAAAAVGAVVADATARAQAIVRAARPAGAPAALASEITPPPDDLELEDLISSCVGVLLAAKLATAPDACPAADTASAPDQAPAAGRRLPLGAAWAALDGALARLVPRSAGSAEAFASVRRAVDALKAELAHGGGGG